MRKYPEPSDYQAAIQNPPLVFRQPELQACRVRVNQLGMPVVSSGGFALSFYLQAPGGQQWVVRCFKANSLDRRARYDAISRFLNDHPDPLLLDVDYYDQGILVDGAWYPIVKMPLVRGVTLQRYVEAELMHGRSIAHLSTKFRAAVRRLEQLGIAHGDLQHGNIMVQAGQLVLVDYDGMYVPDLCGWPPAEIGSAAYQHPLRADQFGPNLDRFSAIVIDLALQALVARPDWWTKYNTGENLLFRRADFLEPQASALLTELEQIPHLRAPARNLRAICQVSFEATPRLEDAVLPLAPVLSGAPASRADDIDEQLDRLYASWSPPVINRPAPVTAVPVAPVLSSAPASAPVAHAAKAQAGAQKQPPQEEPWQEIARLIPRGIKAVFMVFWFVTFFGSLITSTFKGMASFGQPPARTVSSVCPANLQVTLEEPREYVINEMVQFSWRTTKKLAEPCRFQIKLWRQPDSPMFVNPYNTPKRVGDRYTTEVYMPILMPPEKRTADPFYWTVELTAEQTVGAPIPTEGEPLRFYWKPPG